MPTKVKMQTGHKLPGRKAPSEEIDASACSSLRRTRGAAGGDPACYFKVRCRHDRAHHDVECPAPVRIIPRDRTQHIRSAPGGGFGTALHGDKDGVSRFDWFRLVTWNRIIRHDSYGSPLADGRRRNCKSGMQRRNDGPTIVPKG
jgi:hypothetical protein